MFGGCRGAHGDITKAVAVTRCEQCEQVEDGDIEAFALDASFGPPAEGRNGRLDR